MSDFTMPTWLKRRLRGPREGLLTREIEAQRLVLLHLQPLKASLTVVIVPKVDLLLWDVREELDDVAHVLSQQLALVVQRALGGR